MERFTDVDPRKSRADVDDVEKTSMEEMSIEDPLHDDDVAYKVKNVLRWQMPRGNQKRRWIGVGSILAIALLGLMGFTVFARRGQRQDDALLATTMNATLGIFVINLKKQTDRRDRMLLAADLIGLKVEFLDAVGYDDVDRKAIPWTGDTLNTEDMTQKVFASWRSHVNAVQAVVDQNLGSALIMEDDADWDVRIKEMMRDWALTSRQLLQPLARDHSQYLDPTYYKANSTKYNEVMEFGSPVREWDYTNPPEAVLEPTESAYGDLDRWDILWLGHCGQRFAHPGSDCYKTPLGRVTRHDDETAVQTQWYDNWVSGHEYANTYDNHTRVTHWSCGQVCNTAYAVSHQGARKLLYDYGIRVFRGMSDAVLRMVCNGKDPYYELRTCLSVSPPLFNQYKMWDDHRFGHTANIRLSTEANLAHLVNGEEPVEQWEDGKNKVVKEKEQKEMAQKAKEEYEARKKKVIEVTKAFQEWEIKQSNKKLEELEEEQQQAEEEQQQAEEALRLEEEEKKKEKMEKEKEVMSATATTPTTAVSAPDTTKTMTKTTP